MDKGRPIEHGGTGTKPYKLWRSIIQRCHGGGADKHENYGGRGIKMYDPWLKDFTLFRDYIIQLPNYGKPGLTLDRINNDGNYELGNLRWVNMSTQRVNSRTLKSNKIGQRNIRRGYKGKFRVTINRQGIRYYISNNFKTLEEAIIARDNFLQTQTN